jgi:DNA-binding transcriptional ArsR family regulator
MSRLCDEGPQSITKLAVGFDVTRQAITKHLYTMAEAGLLHTRREGRESLWEILPERLEEARHYLELISKQWDHSLARLKKLVEE